MSYNKMTFGEFIVEKRKERDLSARQLAIAIGITPEYMCEIEKGRKSAISEEYTDKLIRVLLISGEELDKFYDLLAIAQNTVSADLTEYIMENELVRAAIRTAKKNRVPDEKWEKFIKEIIKKD
jgi:transcriptional regulator with XRE-family HTH domain